MRFKEILATQKFTLEVTMPQSIEFVDAVLKGGAQALKMRCNNNQQNKLHNGIHIGSFQERKNFLQEVVAHAGEVPVGLVPGNISDMVLTRDEVREVEEMGIDYINTAPDIVPCYLFDAHKLNTVAAVTPENTDPQQLIGINADPHVDIVEGDVVRKQDMGTPLVYQDILKYRALTKQLHQPVIATGQRIVTPDDMRYFYDAGCKCFMLGVVAFQAYQEELGGGPLTPETCTRLTEMYREAIEKLN